MNRYTFEKKDGTTSASIVAASCSEAREALCISSVEWQLVRSRPVQGHPSIFAGSSK